MKILKLLLVSILLAAQSLTAFAAGEPNFVKISSEKVGAGEKVSFQIFETAGGEAMSWPKDYLAELEMHLGDYPNGIWGVHKVFSIQDLEVSAGNTFSFHVPMELNHYLLTMKNGVGDRFGKEVFEVIKVLPDFRFVEGNSCDDLEGHWANGLIGGLLMKGEYPLNGQGLCRPDEAIAREKLIAWLMMVFYPNFEPSVGGLENPYSDLDSDFGEYVLIATDAGVVNGQGGCAILKTANCKFGTGSVVNRAEILKMAIEAIGVEFTVENLKEDFPEKDPLKMFVDVTSEDVWFYPYLYFATANGVIEGIKLPDGSYKAAMSDGLTFSQAAKIIHLISQYGSAQ